MRLINDLAARLQTEDSYFRQHLIKEDIARLERLREISTTTPDPKAFLKAAMLIGWTPDDMRTFELKPTLEPLLTAIHARLTGSTTDDTAALDDDIDARWQAFEVDRIERLVGCLARVPRPM